MILHAYQTAPLMWVIGGKVSSPVSAHDVPMLFDTNNLAGPRPYLVSDYLRIKHNLNITAMLHPVYASNRWYALYITFDNEIDEAEFICKFSDGITIEIEHD